MAEKGGRVLRAHPFFGMIAWCLFKSLLFPSYATQCRFDVPGVLVSGFGLAASACSYACGRYLRIALGPGLAFHSSLFLVEGSSDGSAPSDRFLSPGQMCSFTPFRLSSRFGAVSTGEWAFLPPLICRFTVGSSGAFPRGNFWGFP